jgi:pantetheine-phosphate adenylyltransferase
MSVKALYPGTFDPPTNGHVDLIQRGAKLFEHLTVGILNNPVKNPLFTVNERVEMLKEATSALGNVSIATFDGMMVEFAPGSGVRRRCCAAFAPSRTTSTSFRWR